LPVTQRTLIVFAAVAITLLAAAPAQAAFPRANREIAFTRDRNGFYAIYTMNADGSNLTRVTNNNAVDDLYSA
jgi:hypothetical protein